MKFQQTLTDRQAEKSAQRDAEWPAFVIKLAGAKTAPDSDSLLASLDRFGRTPDELQAALDRLRERRRLAGLVADIPRHREEYTKHQASLTEELGQFAPVLAAHQQRARELQSLRDSAKSGERDGGGAEGQLRETCPPTLRAAIQSTADRLTKLDDAIQRNGWDTSDCESGIARKSDHSNCSYDEIDERQQAVERLTIELGKLKAERDRMEAQRPPLVDELAKLREQSLSAESI